MKSVLLFLFFFSVISFAHNPVLCLKVDSVAGNDMDISRSESTLLTLAERHFKDDISVQDWERAINKFFEAHRSDPGVREAVKNFVVEFANDFKDSHLPGDYPVARTVTDWKHFFLQHSHYDIKPLPNGKYAIETIADAKSEFPAVTGNVVDERTVRSLVWGLGQKTKPGTAFGSIPEGVTFPNGVNIEPSALSKAVSGNVANNYQFLREVRGTDTPEKIAELRKLYLRRVLLAEANNLWQTELRGK